MTKEMRPLTEEEKKLINKNLIVKKNEIDYNKYMVEYYDLMLAKGLEMNYLKQKRDFDNARKEFVAELDMNEKVYDELIRQLREGVEVKENKKEVNNGEGL